ncbi:MAG: sialidase family protein [Oceanipulchritudo sp.]
MKQWTKTVLVILAGWAGSTGVLLGEETGAEVPMPGYAIVGVLEPEGESNVRCGFALPGEHILIGTEETADVYKSEDGGRRWRKTFDAGDAFEAQDIREMIRAGDGALYASTSGKGDILKSLDGGESWQMANTIAAWRTVGILELSDGTLLAGARMDESGETSVYWSRDGFATLTRVGLPTLEQQNVTCFHDLGGGRVLAGIGFDGTAKIHKSEDSGKSWREVADLEGTYDIFDFTEAAGGLLASTKSTATIYRSGDGGESWVPHFQAWEKGFLGTFARFEWQGHRYLVLSGSDQRDPDRYRHCLLISRDGGETFEEWIELMASGSGGASNVTMAGKETLVVGVGNHSVQGRAFTVRLLP